MIAKQREWFVVCKYTGSNWIGVPVDAHFVADSGEAIRIVAAAMRPGERLRGYWAKNEEERQKAIELHDARAAAKRDWEESVEAWYGAKSHKGWTKDF